MNTTRRALVLKRLLAAGMLVVHLLIGPGAATGASIDTPSAAAANVRYTITPLGPIRPTAINSSGEIVGLNDVPGGMPHAVVWKDGKLTDLGTLGGPTSWAFGINDHGDIVGQADVAEGMPHPFLYSNGVMRDLGTLGGPIGAAQAINAGGQIVGVAQDSQYQTSRSQPFVYGPDHLLPLVPHSADGGAAYAINNHGQIAGGLGGHAFFYDGIVHDLGTLSPTTYLQSEAHGVNNAATVVGWTASADDFTHAFIYANGAMSDIGTLGGTNSYGEGINNLSQVVGYSYWMNNAGDHAFLYENGQMKDLNDLIDPALRIHVELLDATAINDAGQIVGTAVGLEGGAGFLLTPVPDPDGFVWAPVSAAVLLRRTRRSYDADSDGRRLTR